MQPWKYEYLAEPIHRLVTGWFDRAWAARDATPVETFEPFIYCWIAFNAWGACVTGVDQDAMLITRLAEDESLNESFDRLLKENQEFLIAANAFRKWWPIFRAQAIRRGNLPFAADQNIDERKARVQDLITAQPRIQRSPEIEARPLAVGDDFPLTWPNTLRAVYRVRCNLFHGDKSISSETDAQIVAGAFRTLVRMMHTLLPPSGASLGI